MAWIPAGFPVRIMFHSTCEGRQREHHRICAVVTGCGHSRRSCVLLVIEMEGEAISHPSSSGSEMTSGDSIVSVGTGYAKRLDTEPSGFAEVVEDIVFLW